MSHLAYVFIDGAYLRHLAQDARVPLSNPQSLAHEIISRQDVQSWAPATPGASLNIHLARVIYYDAKPDEREEEQEEQEDAKLKEYWDAVELLPDTELGFGSVRGRKPRRQKKVDTLIAVDMLVGAFTKLFSVAVLVAGDSDFVPVVDEVRRRGVMVVVAADDGSLAEDLKRAADRFVPIKLEGAEHLVMKVDGRYWKLLKAK